MAKTAVQKLIDYREALGGSYEVAAMSLGIGRELYHILEDGGVTHPGIVRQITPRLRLTHKQAESLLPENYRTSSKNYEPDKYVERVARLHDPNQAKERDIFDDDNQP